MSKVSFISYLYWFSNEYIYIHDTPSVLKCINIGMYKKQNNQVLNCCLCHSELVKVTAAEN